MIIITSTSIMKLSSTALAHAAVFDGALRNDKQRARHRQPLNQASLELLVPAEYNLVSITVLN